MTRSILLSLIAFLAFVGLSAADSAPVTVKVRPETVYLERAGDRQFLSFDFELLNETNGPLDIEQIRVRAFDKAGRLLAGN